MHAVQLTAFGNPVDGLECVDIPEPDTPGPNQVLIGVEYSPINPNDLMVAQGIYAFRPPLPAVIGNEGVGRVLAVGPGVESVRLGDRVLAPPSSFTWRERIVISAGGLSALPADADPRQLAMLAINPPTAALLLSEYVDLQPGEWVLQNAANSGVGRWVIAFENAWPEDRQHRPAPGTRGRARGDRRRRRCRRLSGRPGQDQSGCRSGGAPPSARWRQWPGDGRARSDALAPLVSFAAMSEGPMSINPLDVIFKPLTMRGFWLGHPEIAAKIGPAIVQAAAMIASGRVHIPVAATYPISSIKQAVAHAQRGERSF